MIYPNFYFERKLWKEGFQFVAGVDEVGRGCLAGPVVTGAVVFPRNMQNTIFNIRIDDSKKLTNRQREIASKWIKENALGWGIGVGNTAEINKKGIVKATHLAFHRAINDTQNRLKNRVDYLLIDAFYIPYTRGLRMPSKSKRFQFKYKKKINVNHNSITDLIFYGKQLAIINGDEKSKTIGAASIIAKVYRDKLMKKLGNNPKYRKYGWEKNKGYATLKHRMAIKKNGITRQHRKLFIRNIVNY